MDRKTKGKYGEALAEKYLIEQGLEIVERNFRYNRYEVDLIYIEANITLVFVEVKLRKNSFFGEPEEFVSNGQKERIKLVAEHYVHEINWQKDIRFDIIAINQQSGEFDHIIDAFY
jgi:putative endonuclease